MDEPKEKKIGKYEYALLKKMKTLNKEEQKQIESYEKGKMISFISKDAQNDFFETPQIPTYKKPSFQNLMNDFFTSFRQSQKKDFNVLEEASEMLDTLIYYFTKDEQFYQSKCLSNLSKPSLSKGLLIIGDYGVGKTAMMRSFAHLFSSGLYEPTMSFKAYNMNELIHFYETSSDKFHFWYHTKGGRAYFDDVKTEKMASNFGKVNLMEKILQNRYNHPYAPTFITCNYARKHPGDLKKALQEFQKVYSPMIYDRLFEMCNILEFKGQSFRQMT